MASSLDLNRPCSARNRGSRAATSPDSVFRMRLQSRMAPPAAGTAVSRDAVVVGLRGDDYPAGAPAAAASVRPSLATSGDRPSGRMNSMTSTLGIDRRPRTTSRESASAIPMRQYTQPVNALMSSIPQSLDSLLWQPDEPPEQPAIACLHPRARYPLIRSQSLRICQ